MFTPIVYINISSYILHFQYKYITVFLETAVEFSNKQKMIKYCFCFSWKVVFASLLGSVWCQRGHYLSPRIDYLPLPFARRMPLFQEVSLIEPRLYAPIIYQSPPQARTDQSLIEDVNKEHSSNEDPITVVSDKEINTIPILSYSNDMAANGGYSYKWV